MKLYVVGTMVLFASAPTFAQDDRFTNCLSRLEDVAKANGLYSDRVTQALKSVQFEQRVVDLDRKQPEFTDTLANYLNRRLTAQRIEQGQQLLATHRRLLDRISEQYGVQPQYLVSFWGLESNFGKNFGSIPVMNSLATLACDERRSRYFTTEFLNALRIVDRGHVGPDTMVGSWAGAMGHTQFMPSTYLQHAVDGDGDGRIDLWGSIPDAMTSAAKFLKALGWTPGVRWGREVSLPKNFAFERVGLDQPRSLSEWRKLGIREADGSALPAADFEAALLVPAGHRGPAFLVYDNFRVIMRWNRSELYALSVGLLAERIAGGPGLHNEPPADAPRLRRDQVLAMQERLAALGHYGGEADGLLGPATRRAIRAFQQSRDWVADGYPDRQVLDALEVKLEPVS